RSGRWVISMSQLCARLVVPRKDHGHSEPMLASMTDTSSALFVIVHGTWGRGIFPRLSSFLRAMSLRKPMPRWFEAESAFRTDLSSLMTSFGITAETISFEWSGSNSVFARQRAAESLRELLLSRGQGRPIVIIAHSHGGNVALQAVDQGYSHPDTTV